MPTVDAPVQAGSDEPTVARIPRKGILLEYDPDDRRGRPGGTAVPINYEELYNLKGRLLTLIDATFTDPEQRKAQKDVVWRTLREWMEDQFEIARNDGWAKPEQTVENTP